MGCCQDDDDPTWLEVLGAIAAVIVIGAVALLIVIKLKMWWAGI